MNAKGKRAAAAQARKQEAMAAARARAKYENLLQDYQELLKEVASKKERLLAGEQKKAKLLTEVKFLRRKFQSLSENPSQTKQYGLKKQASAIPQHQFAGAEPSIGDRPSTSKNNDKPRVSTLIDLNEACIPVVDEAEEWQGNQEPVKPDRANVLNMPPPPPAFWDVGNPVSRVGKRKLSWQDQVALRV